VLCADHHIQRGWHVLEKSKRKKLATMTLDENAKERKRRKGSEKKVAGLRPQRITREKEERPLT